TKRIREAEPAKTRSEGDEHLAGRSAAWSVRGGWRARGGGQAGYRPGTAGVHQPSVRDGRTNGAGGHGPARPGTRKPDRARPGPRGGRRGGPAGSVAAGNARP